jgi:phosphatidylethanolamine/phosphatidyl-N-methylethanolamine N-methyltransferase
MLQMACLGMILHVLNYNLTARIEHKTRLFTRILGNNAVYYYAIFLIASAGLRDFYIERVLAADAGSMLNYLQIDGHFLGLNFDQLVKIYGTILFGLGVLLNLWTLKALGIKGMYNGDSFGFLMDSPVVDGPYELMDEPQYVGTTLALIGSSFYYQSVQGLYLSALMYITFMISVMVLERPHMIELYSQKGKKEK